MGEYVNSKQAQFSQSFVSCGVVEVHHLPRVTSQTAFAIANHLYNKANPRPAAYVLFSDAVPAEGGNSRGALLADYLDGLGANRRVLRTAQEVNPKTGNTIQVFLWHVDHAVFRKWYQEELANRVSES